MSGGFPQTVIATSIGAPAVAVSGTPSVGQVLTATSATAATWQNAAGAGVTSVTAADASVVVTPTTGAVTVSRAALTGDVTAAAGSNATTLATVNAGPGTTGDASHVAQITTNGKGLVTSQTAVAITPAAIGALAVANNLSDVASAATSRTNLGLTGGTAGLPIDPLTLAAAGTVAVGLQVTGDTVDRWQFTPSGFLFGSGAAALDTDGVITRRSANVLGLGGTAHGIDIDTANRLIYPHAATATLTLGNASGHSIAVATSGGKVGFYAATPVVQAAAATDIIEDLIAYGLLAEGENWPLNLGTGAFSCGDLTATGITSAGNVTLSAALGGDVSIAATTADILTTATLGIGVWDVSFQCTAQISPTGTGTMLVFLANTGTATFSIQGGFTEPSAIMSSPGVATEWNSCMFRVIITVTVAGTLKFRGTTSAGCTGVAKQNDIAGNSGATVAIAMPVVA